MTTVAPDNGDLAVGLDALVRAVPGVKTLYRSTSVVGELVGALRPGRGRDSFVLVEDRGESVAIAVTIAVDSSAADTCCAVHDAIADRLLALGYRNPAVRVTVGQILD